MRDDAATITVRRDGQIYFRSDLVTADQLPAKLRNQFRGDAEHKAYIRAGGRALHKSVEGVLDAVRAAGIERVAFLVEKRRA